MRAGYCPRYFYFVSVHKHTKIELGQYPVILTGQGWTCMQYKNPYNLLLVYIRTFICVLSSLYPTFSSADQYVSLTDALLRRAT